MLRNIPKKFFSGFTIIELMVGMAVGLLRKRAHRPTMYSLKQNRETKERYICFLNPGGRIYTFDYISFLSFFPTYNADKVHANLSQK